MQKRFCALAERPHIIFLLATDGIGQVAWGVLYILVAERERRYIRFMFLLKAAKSGMILFTEYVSKPPVPAVPGRFMHMTTLVVATVLLLLSAKQEKSAPRN